MKLSLMTINIIIPLFMKFQSDGNIAEIEREYMNIMALAHKTGFEAVDIISPEIQILGVEKVKEILINNHLKVSSYIHCGQFATMDEDIGAKTVADGKAAVDIGKLLGTKVVMMVPEAQENILDYSRDDLASQLIKHWIPIVKYATKKNMHIVVEDTPDIRIPLGTMEELRYVLNRVSNLKVVYDSGNMLLVNEDPIQYYDTFANLTEHIHLKDMRLITDDFSYADVSINDTKMAGALHGKGLVDFKTLLSHVKKNGYKGYLTVEYGPLGDECLHHEENFCNAISYLNSLY